MHTDMETRVHTQTENITPHAETPTQRYLQRKGVRESLMQYTGGEGGFRMKPHQKQLDAIPALTCIRICVTMLNLCESTRDTCGLLPVAAFLSVKNKFPLLGHNPTFMVSHRSSAKKCRKLNFVLAVISHFHLRMVNLLYKALEV